MAGVIEATAAVKADSTTLTGTYNKIKTTTKDDFLKILVAQLQNQDPLEPMKPDQFLLQLAQLTQVEQLQTMTESLDNMSKLSTQNATSAWMGAIGRRMRVESDVLSEGDTYQVIPEGTYTKATIRTQNVVTGEIQETTFKPGEIIQYQHNGTDPVKVTVSIEGSGGQVSYQASALRIISGVSMVGGNIVLLTKNGNTFTPDKVSEITL
jgi:flagellar basal-body rod modification protein FlgD